MWTSLPLRSFSITALALVASACAGGEPSSEAGGSHVSDGDQALLRPCDPLAAQELPIELGSVIAAGRDRAAVIYVAATPPGDLHEARVFVSRGDTLYRKRVLGSGMSGTGADADFTWSFDGGLATHRLVAERRAGAITGVALAAASERTFYAELGPEAERLTIIDANALSDLKLRDLPGEVVVEYRARAEDGNMLVVTRPRDDWSYEDFRLFYGRDGQLSERAVADVGRARDGGTTHITFSMDGQEYEAYFPSPLGAEPSGAMLSGPGEVLPLTQEQASADSLSGFSFACLPS